MNTTVYTKSAPKGTMLAGQNTRQHSRPHVSPVVTAAQKATGMSGDTIAGAQQHPMSAPLASTENTIHASPTSYTPQTAPSIVTTSASTAPSSAKTSPMAQSNNQQPANGRSSNSSTVMNETLSVIDEHITDMRKPGRSASPRARRMTSDSASEYSTMVPSENRLSYIPGSESEEEESERHTAKEVKKWSPEKVAEYLASVGVEQSHCDIFREQEFSGDVILGMEQSQIFLRELELGPIGRRLKTWQKIRALQDEVSPPKPSQTRKISENSRPESRRASNGSNQIFPRPGQSGDKPAQDQVDGPSTPQQQPKGPPTHPGRSESTVGSTLSMISASVRHSPRPSAASIRSLGHSRRQSSIDQTITSSKTSTTSTPPTTLAGHSKQPSFDRNWNMSNASGQANGSARPISSAHGYSKSSDRPQFDKRASQLSLSTAGTDIDRGYVSGSEADGRSGRRVLRKRDADHSRASSYETNKRLSFFRRRSRASSLSRTPDVSGPSSAIHFRSGKEPAKEAEPSIKAPSDSSAPPAVTNLEEPEVSPSKVSDEKVSFPPKSPRKGLRAISDTVTGHNKASRGSWADNISPTTDVSTPHSASSGTPSGSAASKSMELDDANSGKYSTPVGQPMASRRKSKKQTSAYTRGLMNKSPQEQMIGCDYSGWMKKKSPGLVTKWKPRLFVLKGKRLSYYYSENDTQERGLIDISGHRVLNANDEFFTGIHASLAKATSSPTSPQVLNSARFTSSPTKDENTDSSIATPTSATDTSSIPNTPKEIAADGQGFIFKLMPPRAGMSRAVNFTKPTVHYFAVPSKEVGKQWMAALVKATISRDDNIEVITTYQQKTISLDKAQARKERPPALQEADSQTVGGASEADSQLEKVDEALEAERAEEAAEEARKQDEGFSQMREVTDLSPIIDRNSISPKNEKRSSRSRGKSSGSGDGLGIKGLNNGSPTGAPVLNSMQKAGLW